VREIRGKEGLGGKNRQGITHPTHRKAAGTSYIVSVKRKIRKNKSFSNNHFKLAPIAVNTIPYRLEDRLL